jgi:hypothetical protein
MNIRREVPTNYSNALKANIKTKINARTTINSNRKKRAIAALNVLFTKKPKLRPEPEPEGSFNRRQIQKQEPNQNNAKQAYRQYRETFQN